MKKIILSAMFLLFTMTQISIAGECREFIETLSAKQWSQELGKSDRWVISSFKVHLWENPSDSDRGKIVGKLLPGSRALIVEKRGDYYKVKSPLDKSIGWINKIQIERIVMQDDKTYEPCK